MKTRRTIMVSALAGSLSCALCAGQVPKGGTVRGKGDGLRVVHVGNSHSHALRLVEPLARAVGHRRHTNGEVNILGAPLRWNWDHPEQNKWPQTLAAGNKWDAITLLAWAGDDGTYAPKFAAEAFKGNPRCQVFLYTIWPDTYMDWEDPGAIRTEAHTEKVAAALEKAFPDKPKPRVIPSSLLIRELGRLADAGRLPGVANRYVLFSDGGHLSEIGMYAVDVLVCAMLYDESPLAYPSRYGRMDREGNLVRGWYDSLEIADQTARVIRRTAWDVLLTYPPAGLAERLVVADRHLPPAVAAQPYKARLRALNAEGPSVWSLVDGRLPGGMALSRDGTISGKASRSGEFPITLKVADTKGSFERALTLRVSEDRLPVIGEAAVKSIALDHHCFQELKADGGVGGLKWDLAKGKLPFGIQLTATGILLGTPGESGEFRFTARVTDSHPAGKRLATRAFTWSIGPPSPQAMLVRAVKRPRGARMSKLLEVNGKLDEPCWRLDQAISRKVAGSPTKRAAFGAFWVDGGKGRGEAVHVAVKVVDGPAGKTPKDAVHLFLDGRHNREVIYNADDLHVVIPRRGRPVFVRSHTPWWFMQTAVGESADGYVVEVRIGSAYFQGKGIAVPFGGKAVYGFDVAVDEGDQAVSRQAWRGSGRMDEDTRSFGTIVLTETPAEAKP
ncbi:MAG: putative Ig domain-containing protein [Phycisphaerae bacterium]